MISKFSAQIGVLVLFIVLNNSCKNAKDGSSYESGDSLLTINVEKIYNDPMRDLMLSEVVDHIEYIKLETSPDCIIGQSYGIAVSDNYIVAVDAQSHRILLFSRQGKYLNDIGGFGKGPDEYTEVDGRSLEISPDEKLVVFRDHRNKFHFYNLDGSLNHKFETPGEVLDGNGFMNNNEYALYQQMYSHPDASGFKLLIYDKNLQRTTDNFLPSDRVTRKNYRYRFARDNVSLLNGQVYFRESLNDTIFLMNATRKIKPFLVCKLGRLKMPELEMSHDELRKGYLVILDMTITQQFCYLTLDGRPRQLGAEGPVEELLRINTTTSEAYFIKKHPTILSDGMAWDSSMPINDLDGVGEPINITYGSKNGIATDMINIFDAKSQINSDSFDSSKLSTDIYYKQLMKLLDESDIDDNPIIRICYLK